MTEITSKTVPRTPMMKNKPPTTDEKCNTNPLDSKGHKKPLMNQTTKWDGMEASLVMMQRKIKIRISVKMNIAFEKNEEEPFLHILE
jgi:PBP1b-binding outer membrane lipoprotein LpoB